MHTHTHTFATARQVSATNMRSKCSRRTCASSSCTAAARTGASAPRLLAIYSTAGSRNVLCHTTLRYSTICYHGSMTYSSIVFYMYRGLYCNAMLGYAA